MASPETLTTSDLLTSSLLDGKETNLRSPLCPPILGESCHQAGAADLEAEAFKLYSNRNKCQELAWVLHSVGSGDIRQLGQKSPCHDTLASRVAIHQGNRCC